MTDTPPEPPPPAGDEPGTDVAVREPWHQLVTESTSAYEHFRAYLRMEKRSIRKLAEERGVHPGTLSDLSSLHQWVARVQAHDHHMAVIEDAEWEAEKRRIGRNAARTADTALTAAHAAIRAGVLGLQPYLEAGAPDEHGIVRNAQGRPVERLNADQSLSALRAGTRSAVAAKQLVTDRTPGQQSGPGDLDEAGIDEVAYGLDVFDLAQLLVVLTGKDPFAAHPAAAPPSTVAVDADVVDAPAVAE